MDISASGFLSLNDNTLNSEKTFSAHAVQANTWTHVAWVASGGQWRCYVNGVQDPASCPCNLTYIDFVCVGANMYWVVHASPYPYYSPSPYKIFQPIITASAKYTSNFTPANDLSVGASSNPVVFFLNPGIAGSLQDLATGSTVTTLDTPVTATGFRYLA